MDLTSGRPYWTYKNALLPVYPSLAADERCDVAVLGAGITGSLVAEALTADGLDVVVLDGRDAASGSTSASTALLQYEVDTHLIDLIRLHGRENAELAYRACHESIDILERRILDLGINCDFARKDSVYLASRRRDAPILREEAVARRAIGIDVRDWTPADVASHLGFASHGALHSVQAAEVDPYQLSAGLLAECVKRGARVYDRTRINGLEVGKEGIEVKTERGFSVQAKRVVAATGYETGGLFSLSHLVNLNSSFALASEPLRDDQRWWRDCLLWESARPYFYLRTDRNGRVILGGEDVPFRNATAREKLIPAKTRKLEGRFAEMFPAIPLETACSWAGAFGETEDGLAYIGACPQHPLTYFALGFGGNGVTYSVVAAEILREEMKGKVHPYAKVFRFDR